MSAYASAKKFLVRLAILLGLALSAAVLAPLPAHAAVEDQIDSFSAEYIVNPSGTTSVTETIVWRFGDQSGRHGIDRQFVTREQWNDEQDAVYEYKNIDVTSPDRGVSTQTDTSTATNNGGRGENMRLRIGDPNRTIRADTATYVITYDVVGAIRSPKNVDQLFWDVTGNFESSPPIEQTSVTVSVPGGVTQAACYVGAVQSKDECASSKVIGGVATFTANRLAPGEGLTVVAGIAAGAVADNTPTLVERGDRLSGSEKTGIAALGGVTVLSAIAAPLFGRRWWNKNGRDERYIGLPPGTVPLSGSQDSAPVGVSDPDITIPVAFSPPKISVAAAGFLIDGQIDTVETTATIVDLAARGVLRIEAPSPNDVSATLLDPSRATAKHEVTLLTDIFEGQPPGATARLTGRGELATAHTNLARDVRAEVERNGLFLRTSTGGLMAKLGILPFVAAVFLFGSGNAAIIGLLLLPIIPIIITVAVIRSKMKRGKRSAQGRALTDQIEGFRTYLATAEANQLRFEEGEDIFSRYLPWAIIFDLTDRWAKICQDLVAAGRIPDVAPSWYYGNVHWTMFNYAMMSSALSGASAPVPPPSSSGAGTGFGGGSGFGGGGFSGGGGGGGGFGSW